MKSIIVVRSETFSYFSCDKIRHIQLKTSIKAELKAENQCACFSWKAVFGGFLRFKMENKAEQQMFMVTLVYFSVLLRCTFIQLWTPDLSPGRSNPEQKVQLWKFKHSSVIHWLRCLLSSSMYYMRDTYHKHTFAVHWLWSTETTGGHKKQKWQKERKSL